MKNVTNLIEKRPWIAWLIFFATIVVVFLIGLLASSIVERRAEAVFVNIPKKQISQWEPRNNVWGENFPREYDSFKQTSDTTFGSKYNGSRIIDMLEVDPRLVVLWAGYSFSKEYNQSRGHAHAVEDIITILRTGAPTDANTGPAPSTCWTCKSPDVPRLMHERGVAAFYTGKWASLGSEVVNPIGCADCHDAKTMNLHISRPALIEAFERQGKDIKNASHQEMRSLVCAQCHVEYYFDKKKVEGAEYLTFPWDKGMTVEAMEKYYDEIEFSDWTHTLSRAPMLKAQHPDYEVHLSGIHAERGVSCADCHMPYKSEGGQKLTDHHIQSPLNNVANSCQVCHREETMELVKNVYDRQDKIIENRNKLEELIVHAHVEAKKAWDLGASETLMKDILQGIRHSQWRWDYSAASHGASFHSPVEISRVISTGITIVQETRIKLARILAELGNNKEVPYPDIETKAKAQQFIGLDMEQLNREKKEFKKTLVPQWKEQAKQREATYGIQ
ncbi:MAG: ammonia-forming cytochrome c nitrite reductase subunit c552 [Bacteroidetes bacterium GWF2_42_66]|nr:MAG: ammonia-forming cytochrome c nitrite reductase subunit c552 [Bacteroidetes bacterium GWE2_42_39]OFY44701.1 MAG: ammonia-forming cytochrome c nitrite reductase subunit c552 [Bacteroidetes bacterium GWF2_42_66]HBL75007.1 ammonia-forming cytochrome c nitrite reductase [Prolixibacteraceae bacterium]HCU60320.1 ammonia-forming cytochrome c nitrite reductase [Prolixibacteraceae bacterium]